MTTTYDDGFFTQPITNYTELFASLPCPTPEQADNRFLAQFIGPSWLRWIAPKLLPLGGLSGWAGKSFLKGEAINLVRRDGSLVEHVPMHRETTASVFAHGNALCLTYDKRAPLPLRNLRDELRSLDQDTLLGLTIVDLPILRRFPMPFLLKRIKQSDM